MNQNEVEPGTTVEELRGVRRHALAPVAAESGSPEPHEGAKRPSPTSESEASHEARLVPPKRLGAKAEAASPMVMEVTDGSDDRDPICLRGGLAIGHTART